MTIWIDIENTPHVPFFKPIIAQLQKKGIKVVVTARNYGGVEHLLREAGIEYHEIGGDYGKNFFAKIFGVINRIIKLYFFVRKMNISGSVSHGSRTHIGAAWLAGIPSLTSYDYEYSSKFLVHPLASKVIIPQAIPDSFLEEQNIPLKNILRYHGFKEQVYLEDFFPKEAHLPKELLLNGEQVIVLVRPPASRSHYYSTKSKDLFSFLLEKLRKQQGIYVVFSPRDFYQKEELYRVISDIHNFQILDKEVDGLSLIWQSDLVISGGGTMNREAALLGVPVYSIYGGAIGCVDKELEKLGRLQFIHVKEDFDKVRFKKRNTDRSQILRGNVRDEIINAIIKISTK